MFGSIISYIALRLLGEGPDDGEANAVTRGRQWILDHGGATGIPSWGKFWLTVCQHISPFVSFYQIYRDICGVGILKYSSDVQVFHKFL